MNANEKWPFITKIEDVVLNAQHQRVPTYLRNYELKIFFGIIETIELNASCLQFFILFSKQSKTGFP